MNAETSNTKARVGILSPVSAEGLQDHWDAFKNALLELGYRQGANIEFVSRFAEGRFERLPALAAELVQLGVDVIVPATPPAIHAAKAATNTIPIVFPVGSDPVETGLVSSYERPGGNITGVATMSWQLSRLRMALLRELIPTARRVALIRHSANAALELQVRESRAYAKEQDIDLLALDIGGSGDLPGAFRSAKEQGVAALMALSDPMAASNAQKIGSLSFECGIPVISPFKAIADAGGVLAYGPSIPLLFRRGASLVGRVLQGAKPGDLPIEQPSEFELIVNLNAAGRFQLAVPESLLARAAYVIH